MLRLLAGLRANGLRLSPLVAPGLLEKASLPVNELANPVTVRAVA
jgi:hypothetical protein